MSSLGKLLAIILEWPKTTVLLALALVGGGAFVSQRLAVDVFPRRADLRPKRWSSASPCRSSPP